MTERCRIVIVGGGLAGMAAALALSETDSDITLLESRSSLGGRASSFYNHSSNSELDYCQHVTMGCCTNVLDLLDKSGQLHEWTRHRELAVTGPNRQQCSVSASKWLPAPLHLSGALSRLSYLSKEDQSDIRRGIWKLMRHGATQNRRLTMRTWLVENGQSDRSIRLFWEFILVSALGESIDRVAFAPARKVIIDGFVAHRSASDIWIPNHPLSQLFGTWLTEHLRSRGVSVRLKARVIDVPRLGDRVTGVQLSDGSRIDAQYVVSAVPWHQLSRTLGVSAAAIDQVDSISQMPSSPITGIHLWCDRPISHQSHIAFSGLLPQWMFQPNFANARSGEHYHQIVISASHDIEDRETLPERVLTELAQSLPQHNQPKLLRSFVVTDKNAVLSVSRDSEQRRPPTATAIGNLLLAGDWTATGWPSTMESAVISGRRAAEQICQKEGRPRVFQRPQLSRNILSRSLIRG